MIEFKDVPTMRVSGNTYLSSIRNFIEEHPDDHVIEASRKSDYTLYGMLDGVSFAFRFSNEEVPWARLSYGGIIVAEMCDNPLNRWAVSSSIQIPSKLDRVKDMILGYCRTTV